MNLGRSKEKITNLLWLCLAGVFAIVSTWLMLTYMVTEPGHVFNELGGDTGKNYFTFIYHTLYGHGFWFDGMNYPYGDNIIYADGQPIISTTLQLLHLSDPHQALAAMNLLISFSYVLAIIFTYKTLRVLGLQAFLAIIFACLINLLSPQIIRLRSHFGMAYLFPLPMLFYFSLLYHNTQKWKWAFYILILGIIASFIHLYLGILVILLLVFYILWSILLPYIPFFNPKNKKDSIPEVIKKITPMGITLILLFASIKLFVILTDPISDRPTFPVNNWDTVTHLNEIFSSTMSPFWQFLIDHLGYTIKHRTDEGYSYLGLVSIVVLSNVAYKGIRKIAKKQPLNSQLLLQNGFAPIWIFIAISTLLLGMGIPFIWHMKSLLNYMATFKQFRAMGRFSWIFYYIISIYSVCIINVWYSNLKAKRKIVQASALLVLCISVWSYEVYGYATFTKKIIGLGRKTSSDFFLENDIKWTEYLKSKHYKPEDFQAILLSPFFFSGTEKIWVGGDPSFPMSIGMMASIEMHLPMVDIMMSRSSWSITQKQVKLGAGKYVDKPMLRDLKSNKPFLLIQFEESVLTPDEQYVLACSDFIGEHYRANIYACYPDRLLANYKRYTDSIKLIAANIPANTDSCIINKGPWYIKHYDVGMKGAPFFGAGACYHINTKDSIVADFPVNTSMDSQLYELSCWFLLENKNFASPYFIIRVFDQNNNQVGFYDAVTKESVDNDGMWFRTNRFFYIKPDCARVELTLWDDPYFSYLSMDELMLKPADAVIVSKDLNGKVMVNNHRVEEN